MVLQQARHLGVRVIWTASPSNFGYVRRFGGIPVEYGPGLLDRVRAAAPEGIAAALDTVGSDEAGDVSLALVDDRKRVVTIAAAPRARADGYVFVGASNPESGPFRAGARSRILALAQAGELVVPMAQTFKFDEAPRLSRCSPARIHPARSLWSTIADPGAARSTVPRDGRLRLAHRDVAQLG